MAEAVDEVSMLPGIGKRTALRLVLHLLKQPESQTLRLADSLASLRSQIQFCEQCHNISDSPLCDICSNPNRDDSVLCVVEDIRDVMAIEHTSQFRGKYHVLGGKISPMEGIGPSDLQIDSLVAKAASGQLKEVIFAMSSTMEGDTTNFFVFKQLAPYDIATTTIARGIAVGDELEYADQVTLGRSILQRIPFEASLKNNGS